MFFQTEFYKNQFDNWEYVLKYADILNIYIPDLDSLQYKEDEVVFKSLINQFESKDFDQKEKVIDILKTDKVYHNYKLYKDSVEEQKLYDFMLEKGIKTEILSKKVYSILLDFTPEEWVEIVKTEGEHLPSCCAVISNIRDKLINCLRDNGMIRSYELQEIVLALKNHHDTINFLEEKLFPIWEAVEPYVELKNTQSKDLNNINDAFDVLLECSSNWFYSYFTKDENEKTGCKLQTVVKLSPAITTIYEYMKQQCGDQPLKGYVIVNEKDGKIKIAEIVNNNLLFFEDIEDCKKMLLEINKVNPRLKFGFVPFEVQLGKQIKFLGEISYV